MKITSWNARGLNAPSKKRLLCQNLKAFESDIIMLQETKLNKDEYEKFNKKIDLWKTTLVESNGASRGLDVLWDLRKINLTDIRNGNNWICAKVSSVNSNMS